MRLRILVFLLCLLAGPGAYAQDTVDYAPLADRLATYGQLTMQWDIDGLLDLTVPDLFEIVPRATLREQMSGLQSDEHMRVTFHDFTIDRIGEAVTDFGASYAPVDFHHAITFELLSPEYRAADFAGRMVRMLEKTYPNVRYDAAKHRIDVNAAKSLYAIQAAPDAEWYFVEYRPENAALMDLLVPERVRELLK